MYIYIYILIFLYGYIYVYAHTPVTIVSGESKDDESWGDLDEVDPTDGYSPTMPPHPFSPPSPELSLSPQSPLLPSQRSPYQSPPRIDLTHDDERLEDPTFNDGPAADLSSVVLPLGFDPDPEFVMMDEEARGCFWCDHCSMHFSFRSVLHEHLRTTRHRDMINFLNGEPMIFCVVCKTLPEMPCRHESSRSHRRKVMLLGRYPREADVALRQVVMGANRRKMAILLPESE
jgi:hypothetical protein